MIVARQYAEKKCERKDKWLLQRVSTLVAPPHFIFSPVKLKNALLLLALSLPGCSLFLRPSRVSPPPAPSSSSSVRVSVIGDFGNRSCVERWAARDIDLNSPASILTVGDNVYPYPNGLNDYETHVGEFFGHWIREGRFFPAIGNHDWNGPGESETFQRFFSLPRYYDVVIGPFHFYVIDSDDREPDGIGWDSKQAAWFRERITANPQDIFRFVVFHHPAVSTKVDQSSFCVGCEPVPQMDWPWAEWGIDGVLSGHAHWAERFLHRGVMHWTVGATTDDLDPVGFPVDSRSRFMESRPGYLMMEGDEEHVTVGFRFANDDSLSDVIVLGRKDR